MELSWFYPIGTANGDGDDRDSQDVIRHDGGRTETVVPGRVAVGTVRGPVRLTGRPVVGGPLRRLPLLTSGLLVFVLSGVAALRGGGLIVQALAVLVIVLVAQWILGAVVRVSRRRHNTGPLRDGGSVRRLVGPLLALAGGVNAVPAVDVRQFTVVAVTGQEHRCELVGQPRPVEPRTGDVLQIYGRDGNGSIRVHHMVGVDQTTTRSRLPLAAAAARFAYAASVVVSGLGVLASCWFALRSPG